MEKIETVRKTVLKQAECCVCGAEVAMREQERMAET